MVNQNRSFLPVSYFHSFIFYTQDVLQKPAEEFDNDQMVSHNNPFSPFSYFHTFIFYTQVEELWAMKAFEHADVYFNVIYSYTEKISIVDNPNQIFRSSCVALTLAGYA